MIFTDQIVNLESTSFLPRFFANSLNNEEDITTYLHCLFVYELITPSIVDASKARSIPSGYFDFIESEKDPEDKYLNSFYVPLVICIKSKNNYVDFFRKILKCLYLHLTELSSDNFALSSAMRSMDFLKYCSILINDCIVSPFEMNFSIKIGKYQLMFPYESHTRMNYNESAVAILVDLLDIRNIIDIWENLMTNKHVFLMSCNEYLLFLIIQAFRSLMFPMKWEDKVIPVLAPHLIDVLDCPFPILIGINTSKIPKDQAFERLEGKIILDIDSNTIYYEPSKDISISQASTAESKAFPKYEELLCECEKSSISRKLQLVKSYYYVDSKRISIFRKLQMEKGIDDQGFVENARKLLEIQDSEEKENLFVELVKMIFFKVIADGMNGIELFMKKKHKHDYVFDKEAFRANQGYCKKCRNNEFWRAMIENSNFQQLIKYFGKYDDSNISRFIEIIKKKRSGNNPTTPLYNFMISPCLSPKSILEILLSEVSALPAETCEEKFKKKTAEQVINDLNTILQEKTQFYEDPELVNLPLTRRYSFTYASNYSKESTDFRNYQSTFYGKYGIIRTLNGIFSLGSQEIFSKLSTIFEKISSEVTLNSSLSPKKYEPLLLKLLYSIKNDPNLNDFQEIIDQMSFMNKKCPEFLSAHVAFFVLNNIFEKNPKVIELLSSIAGKLGKIARDVTKNQEIQRQNSGNLQSQDDYVENTTYLRTMSMYTENDLTKERI